MLPQSHPKNAFTLLELLVVVAVIALLLAILLPGLSAAMEAGRAAVCGNNLNQLFHGSFVYMEENDQRLPWYGWAHYRPAGQEWWVTQVATSMDAFEPQVFACRSDPLPLRVSIYIYSGSVYMADRGWHSYLPQRAKGKQRLRMGVSYRGSCDLHYEKGGPNSGQGFEALKVTAFTRPSSVIQMVEGVFAEQYQIDSFNQKECYRFASMEKLAKKSGQKYHQSFGRHFGTSNICFIDGHVDRQTPQALAAMVLPWKSYMTDQARRMR